MNRFSIRIADKSYTVEVHDPRQSPLTIVVDGEAFNVTVESLQESGTLPTAVDRARVAGVEPADIGGVFHVTAPMPGTILDVAVKVDDQVQQGQVLCALEAMKMKSPIRAAKGGAVQQVNVHEGQSVDHGDLLFVVG